MIICQPVEIDVQFLFIAIVFILVMKVVILAQFTTVCKSLARGLL